MIAGGGANASASANNSAATLGIQGRAKSPRQQKATQQKTKECSLYGFLIQQRSNRGQNYFQDEYGVNNKGANGQTPYAKLVQFCKFLLSDGASTKAHQVKFRDTVVLYSPKQRDNYWKVGQMVTHEKVSLPQNQAQYVEDHISDLASTLQSDFERVSADLTGCHGVFYQSQFLKLFCDKLQKSSNVTIKQCHTMKAAKGKGSLGQHLTDVGQQRDNYTQSVPKENEGLRHFAEGSGFKRQAIKQLFGDEFKFVLNDYPDVCKFALGQSDLRTVKLRIYKVFTQESSRDVYNPQYNFFNQDPNMGFPAPQQVWKEANILEELFEVETSEEAKADPYQQPGANNQLAPYPDEFGKDGRTGNNGYNQFYENDNGQPGGMGQNAHPGSNNSPYGMMGHPGNQGASSAYPGRLYDYSHQGYKSEASIGSNNVGVNGQAASQMQVDYHGGPQKDAVMGTGSPEAQNETKLSAFEIYHVELTGMCTDNDQKSYTKMLADFAQKFSNYVELAPVQLNTISEVEE